MAQRLPLTAGLVQTFSKGLALEDLPNYFRISSELCRHMFMVPGHDHVWSAGKTAERIPREQNFKMEPCMSKWSQGSGIFADLILWEAQVSGVSGCGPEWRRC